MNYALKTSLITGLLVVAFQSNLHADDSIKDAVEPSISQAQYIFPPPSPMFSSRITSYKSQKNKKELKLTILDSKNDISDTEDTAVLNEETSINRISELEMALKDNQEEVTNLVDELHATAKNADFENEMYEKTVTLLQEKIITLSEENKKLTSSHLAETQSIKSEQQNLLSTITQESTELDELKDSYSQSKEEVSSLKKQVAYFEAFIENDVDVDAKVQTLEDAYTAKSEEAEELKVNLNDLQTASQALLEKIEGQNTEIVSLKGKVSSEEQTQAELVDLQNAAAESNDSNVLLKAKIIELDDVNKSLKSQLTEMEQNATQQTQKLGLLDQSTAELTTLRRAYKESSDEAIAVKDKLSKIEETNKALATEVEALKTESIKNSEKLSVLEKSAADLAESKSSYIDSNNESIVLKSKLQGVEVSNQLLLNAIETLKTESSQKSEEIGLLEQSTTELTALKASSEARDNEMATLKEKSLELDNSNKALTSKIQQLESDSSEDKQKLGLMEQSTAELTELKSAYKTSNDEATVLKKKIIELDALNKTLQLKIEALEKDAVAHEEKSSLLEQTASELTSLKAAYLERDEEARSSKNKLLKLDDSNKTLFSQLEKIKSDSSQQMRKLGLLNQSTAELASLRSAYTDRNNETIQLKKKISDSDKSKQELSNQLTQLKSDNLSLQEKATAAEKLRAKLDALQITHKKLEEDSSTLTAKLNQQAILKNSLDSSASALSDLEKRLDESETLRKTLVSKFNALESDSSNQQLRLTTLSTSSSTTTQELDSLKSAYESLKNEKLALSSKYSAAMQDSDKDGVINELDKCPSSTLGSSVDNIGCPEISDADGDKIPDANDLCADTAINASVNKFGCAANKSITLDGVNFKTGSDRLTFSSLSMINTVANALKANPSIKVEVAGYTDDLGIKSVNQKLSKRRANSVAIQLIEQGVDAARISSKGYGESSPIAPNKTENGRLKNRRVELKIN